MDRDIVAIQIGCDNCGGRHLTKDCDVPMEDVAYVNQQPNNYGRGNFNRPNNNFNNNRSSQPAFQQTQPRLFKPSTSSTQPPPDSSQVVATGSKLELLLTQFVSNQLQINEKNDVIHEEHNQAFRHQQASIQNLEKDVAKIAKMLSGRPMGSMPSNTETNPRKEQAKAITTRSGKEVKSPPFPNFYTDNTVDDLQVTKEKEVESEKEAEKPKEAEIVKEKIPSKPVVKPYSPRIP